MFSSRPVYVLKLLQLDDGVIFGLFGGLILSLIFGGMFALRHFVLRLFLWKDQSAPIHYVAFLSEAAESLFLRQVGGGYIFLHRLLQEYFGSLPEFKEINTAPTA